MSDAKTEARRGYALIDELKDRITDDWQALKEAAHILRQISLDGDPREREPIPVSLETRTAAQSWLAAHDPELRMAGHRGTEG
jgi:hypothetical protein